MEARQTAASPWLDRVISFFAPQWGLQRMRARTASTLLARHYEAATAGRRTQGWRRPSTDANAALQGGALARLRDSARDLVRNNGHAENAVGTIARDVVGGWGILPKPDPTNPAADAVWNRWAGSTDCDADGRHEMAGLQDLVMRTVVESGECLVRRRRRFLEDGLSLPVQLQVLEPDYLDTAKSGTLGGGGRIVHGVELDFLGRRVAYWLFPEHPGSETYPANQSRRIPATDVLHIYHQKRAGQMRGVTWFHPVLLKFKDFDEYDDAQLMKQKIAACLAVLTSDTDGTAPALGATDPEKPEIDSLEPGMILNVAPGRSFQVVQPPRVGEFGVYSEITLRAIATGLGVTYEALTGDYTDLPFSAARMSRLQHWARVESWRWKTLVPQFCVPAWRWAMEAAAILGIVKEPPGAKWTASPLPMIDPDKEGLAYQRNVRTGIMSLSEAIRERGYDPDELLAELAADLEKARELGLALDVDATLLTQAGQAQSWRPSE